MKRSLQFILTALTALVVPALSWAAVIYTNPLAGDATCEIDDVVYKATAFGEITDIAGGTNIPLYINKSTDDDGNTLDNSANIVREHSVSGWFKLTATGSDTTLWAVKNNEGAYSGYLAQITADGNVKVARASGTGVCDFAITSTNVAITDTKWHHITATFDWYYKSDANNWQWHRLIPRVYIDGKAVEIDPDSAGFVCSVNGNTTCNAFYIGAGVTAAGLKVYDTALPNDTDGTIEALYTNRTNLEQIPLVWDGSAEDNNWGTAANWHLESNSTEEGKTPTEEDDVKFSQAAALTVTIPDSGAVVKKMTVDGADLTLTGGALTATTTIVNADTDVSAITADLGAVTIDAGKTLAMSATTFADADSFTRGNGAAIEIKGTDTLTAIPNKENFGNIFYTSGTFVLNQPLTIEGTGFVDFGKTHTVTLLKDITAHKIRTGNDHGIVEVINQEGGTIELSNTETETVNQTSAAIVLGHWPSNTTYNLKSGKLLAESGMLIMGWDAGSLSTVGAYLNIGQQSGEEALLSVKRFTSGRDNNAEITINPTGTLKIGARGLDLLSKDKFTLAGGTLAVADNATIAIQHADGLNVTAASTISAPAEKTATINSTLKGSANLTLTGGGTIDLSNAGKVYTGAITVGADTTAILPEELLIAAGTITLPETATLKIKPSVSSLLLGKVEIELLEGSSINGTIEFVGVDTTPAYADNTITATFTAQSATDAAWWNYEFNGNLSSTGSDTTALARDGGRPTWSTDDTSTDYKDGEALYTATHPYRSATYPSEWTAIISATMPAKENAVLMAFGTLNGGTIALIKGETLTDADGNVTSDEVILARTSGDAAYEVLASMQVPNSTTAAHTYAFVKTPRSINIYLDGSLWKPYTISADASDISFGGGFQIGSVHGGLGTTGYERPAGSEGDAENTTPSSYIDALRTYTNALTAEAITLLSSDFPYVSPNGTYTRTTTADTDAWVADDAWTKAGTDPAETAAHPAAGAVAELTAEVETTVTLNLDADEGLESLTLRGEKITFVADAEKTGKIINAGKTQIDTDVVIPVGSLDISGGPTMIAEGKTLTFTVSEAFLAQYCASTTIPLTGTIEATTAVVLQAETAPVRTTALTYNTTTQSYDLTITVEGELNAYVPAAGATWETLVWRLDEMEIEKPADISVFAAIPLYAAEGATLTLTEDVAANNITLVNDLTVAGANLNGVTLNPSVVLTADVASFTMDSVKAASTVTAETRPTVVLTADEVSLTGAQTGAAAAWHNINLTIAEGTTCNYPSGRNDWTGSTVTVAGTFNAASAQIWLGVSYGSLADADTKLIVSGTATINNIYLGPWGNTTNNAIEVTGTGSLTITTLTLHAATTVAVSVAETASLTVNGTAKGDSWAQAIANVTINGTAKWVDTITGTLTLAGGATLDVGSGLTVVGAITQQGNLAIKTTAEGGTTILTGGENTDYIAESITIADRDDVKAVVEDTTIKLAVTNVCTDGSNSYTSINACIEAMALLGTSDFVIILLRDTAEEVTLPADSTLTFMGTGGTFSGTVKDKNGNVLTPEGGIYDTHTYVASVTVGEETTKCETFDAVLTAIAADTVTDATVTILAATGLELTETWVIDNKAITLDLGNTTVEATFTYTAANPAAIWVKNGGALTLKNGTLSSKAEGIRIGVKGATDAAAQAGTVVIESGANVESTDDIGVLIYGGSSLTSAGSITSQVTAAIQGNGLETLDTTIAITAGSVTSANDVAIYHPQPGTLTLGAEGGTMYPFIMGMTGVEMRAGTLNMLSGTITTIASEFSYAANGNGSTVVGAAIAVSQHTTGKDIAVDVTAGATNGVCSFALVNTTGNPSVNITADLASSVDPDTVQILDPNYTLKATTTGEEPNTVTIYSVAARTTGAIVGNTWYETLQAAYEAATAGQTITLLGDTEAPGLKIAKAVTIDFGGYTYTIVSPGVGSGDKTSNGIQIVQSAEAVTLQNGTIQVAEADAANFYILIQNYADLTLIDMTLDGTNLDKWIAQYGDSYTLSVNSGTVSLEGDTTIKANNDGEKSYAFDVCKYASYTPPTVIVGKDVTITGTVEVSGGTLDNQGDELEVVITGGGTVEGSVTIDTDSDYLVKIGNTYCDEVVDASGKGVEVATAAAELFTGIATVNGTTATVDWDFGISDIVRDGYNVVITAKVQDTDGDDTTAAGYASGVTVTIVDAADEVIGSTTTTAAGIATFTVPLSALTDNAGNAKPIKVKATKTTND